jgi:hypothetical protein
VGLFRIITTTFITNQRPDFVMNEKKDKSKFHLPFHMKAITSLIIVIIVTGILFVSSLILNQNQIAIAQQEQALVSKRHIF